MNTVILQGIDAFKRNAIHVRSEGPWVLIVVANGVDHLALGVAEGNPLAGVGKDAGILPGDVAKLVARTHDLRAGTDDQ